MKTGLPPALLCLAAFIVNAAWALPCLGRNIDLQPHWDERSPLQNPHKGWYHHFPDNHINKYRIARDADLLQFPGMDHLYIRLAWAYLEPEEGRFNWELIDEWIRKWTGHGLGISFRISCKETSTDRLEQQFATPRWVMEAGAQGGHYRMGQPAGAEGPWEPVFDDPIFLQKLEIFLKAFAERYDGQPWLRYLDIGSIGDWGEGHTWAGSRKEYRFAPRKAHIDLHLKYFKKTLLVISDDFVYSAGSAEDRRRMHQYVLDHGISYRDDSILVDGYFAGHSATATVRSPEFFAEVWQRLPTVLELEHYSAVKRSGNWLPKPGSSLAKHGGGRSGADFLREALERLHATYIGYHGDAAEWLADNPELTVELLNRSGYWYFPRWIHLPEVLRTGQTNAIFIEWNNRGVAPAYQPFQLRLRFKSAHRSVDVAVDAGNRDWLPVTSKTQHVPRYAIALPPGMEPGRYNLRLKLHCPLANRPVFLGLQSDLLDEDNYYRIGAVAVE